MGEVAQIKSYVILKKMIKQDVRNRLNVVVFVPVRVTLTEDDANTFILMDTKQNPTLAKQNYKVVETACDLSIPVVRRLTGGSTGLIQSGGGILTPTGTIVTGRPRMDA